MGGYQKTVPTHFLGLPPWEKKLDHTSVYGGLTNTWHLHPQIIDFLDTLDGSKLNFHMEGLPWKYVIWIGGLAIFKRAGHAGADMKIPIHTYFYLFLWILHRSWDRHGGSCLRLLASCHKENMMRRAIAMVNILQLINRWPVCPSAPLTPAALIPPSKMVANMVMWSNDS